ncbi:MAG TPA: protein-methionine-sulfoxide reductase heme-binding subunit MsrQ [Longimicrobiales bacterium]
MVALRPPRWLIPRLFRPALWLVCLAPLGLLMLDAVRGGLGANPIQEATHRTGRWALILLLATLAVTPVRRLTGWNELIRLRRPLGLFAFSYATLHFLVYIAIDQFFAFGDILADVAKRPYITAGFAAFVLLVPLAATSTRAAVRRLGRRWQALHRLVYVSAALGVLHFLWLVKAPAIRRPLTYGAVLALLLLLRLPVGRRRAGRAR